MPQDYDTYSMRTVLWILLCTYPIHHGFKKGPIYGALATVFVAGTLYLYLYIQTGPGSYPGHPGYYPGDRNGGDAD